ncbi:MAG: hypothetical protein ACE5GY_01260 [Thermodesulfobacteriota bacterium]
MRPALLILLCVVALAPGCATLNIAPGPPVKGEAKAVKALEPPSSLRATAIVRVDRIFSVKGRALIAAERPDRFRIEVLGPLNSTLALFVSDGHGLYIFSDGKSARYEWKDPRVPFPFRPVEVVSALLGARPEGAGDYALSMDGDGHITDIVKKGDGEPLLTAAMSDYRTVSGADVPFSITIEDGKKRLGVRYSAVEVNPELGTDFFDTGSLP